MLAQYGSIALEVLETPDEAATLNELGTFAAVLKTAMKTEHMERLTDEQRRIVELWNTRFSQGDCRVLAGDGPDSYWGTAGCGRALQLPLVGQCFDKRTQQPRHRRLSPSSASRASSTQAISTISPQRGGLDLGSLPGRGHL